MTDPEIVKNITDPTMVFWTVLVDKLPEILTALGILIVAVQNILNRKQQKQELTEARATVEKKVDENTAITAEVAHQVVRRLAEVRAKPDEEDKDFRGVYPQRRKRMRRYEVVICAALLAASCSHLSAPPQLSPAGDVAWHARQAVIIVDTMVKATTDGVKSGVITKADGAKVAAAAEVAMKAGNGLVEALEAGMPEAGAKDQFLAALRAALMNLPNQLDSETAKRISIYTDGALKLLSVFGK